MSPPDGGLLGELRRRKVFRVAAVYGAVGFVLVQVANNFFPALHLPPWTTTLVAALVVLGFPVALVLAWALELTPEGIRRASVAAEATGAPGSRRTLSHPAVAGGAVALLLTAGGVFFLAGGGSGEPVAALDGEVERSIAVLPFANLSADAENEYFSDGISEDIRGRLSRMGELRVISRTSAMTYKGTTRTAPEIGRELGVAHLLEGTVQRSNDRLRLAVQLVDARGDRTIWSESFDRDVTDVFVIQSEIAGRIAEALRLQLTTGERALLGRSQTTNLAAYELYLRAGERLRAFAPGPADKRTNVLGAIAFLRQAIALDPEYALPYALLAWGYEEHPDLPLAERRDSARVFADRVISMAPELPDGYAEMGWYLMSLGDLEPAATQFRLALDRDPNQEFALSGMREYEIASGRMVEALRYARHTLEVAPTDFSAHYAVGRTFAGLGDFDAAEDWFRRAWLDVLGNPAGWACERAVLARYRHDLAGARRHLDTLRDMDQLGPFDLHCAASTELALGNLEGTRHYLDRGARVPAAADDGEPFLLLARLALHDGDDVRARALLRQGEERVRRQWELCEGRCVNYQLAQIHALRGDAEQAITFVQRSMDTGWAGWYPSAPDPLMASVEKDPRYQAILAERRARMERERQRLEREGG